MTDWQLAASASAATTDDVSALSLYTKPMQDNNHQLALSGTDEDDD